MKQEIKNAFSRFLAAVRNLRTSAVGRPVEAREEGRPKEVQEPPRPAEAREQEETVAECDRECSPTVS